MTSGIPYGELISPQTGELLARRVDFDMGFYQYELVEAPPPTQVRTGGRWEYVGQAVFYDRSEDPSYAGFSEPDYWDDPADAATDEEIAAGRYQTIRTDWMGRKWRLTEGRSVRSRTETEILSDPTFPTRAVSWMVDAEAASQPLAWSTADCIQSWPTIADHAIEGPESRAVTGYGYDSQVSTVLINVTHGDGQVGSCTGSVVYDAGYVLTAAHCLRDGSYAGGYVPANSVRVCTHGNEYAYSSEVVCSTATDISINPYYGPTAFGGDYSDDFAVITLALDVVSPPEVFVVSGLGPSAWDQYWGRVISHPGYVKGLPISCTPNAVTNAMWYQPLAKRQYREARSDLQYSSNRVKTKFDGAVGASGAPIFYCPSSEDCNISASLIGIWTHWNSTAQRHSGPRANRFRQFVLDNFP